MDFPLADQAVRSVCCKDYDACKSTDRQTHLYNLNCVKKKCKLFIVRQMKEKTSTWVDNVLLSDRNKVLHSNFIQL